jgi:uncharacterized protein HemX
MEFAILLAVAIGIAVPSFWVIRNTEANRRQLDQHTAIHAVAVAKEKLVQNGERLGTSESERFNQIAKFLQFRGRQPTSMQMLAQEVGWKEIRIGNSNRRYPDPSIWFLKNKLLD